MVLARGMAWVYAVSLRFLVVLGVIGMVVVHLATLGLYLGLALLLATLLLLRDGARWVCRGMVGGRGSWGR